MGEPKFRKGDILQRVNQPDAIGVVLDSYLNQQTETWIYQVQIAGGIRGIPEHGLIPFQKIETIWEALEQKKLSGHDHFRSILTFHRLKRPPSRIANSFATAKTDFYPYQFKPLLKFLDHPRKRILIADEVGLGKTIEAGYILTELQAHQAIERVLVLVPSRLKRKWKKELQDRFGEVFEETNAKSLIKIANGFKNGREPEPFKWIVSYEGARTDEVRRALDETQFPIDVLIADEVHRMRNRESLQSKIGSVLCSCSDIVIFLSATPVQNKLEDLYNLFNMLSPEEFGEWELFQSQMDANHLILKAQNAINSRPPRYSEAKIHLKDFGNTYIGKDLSNTVFFKSLIERLSDQVPEKKELIELHNDISRLSPLAHIITRTKKTEVLPNAPRRAARWKPIQLTETERNIYESVETLCKLAGTGGTTNWGFQMSLLTAYRITASCIPASCEYFLEKIGDIDDSDSLNQDLEEVVEENSDPRIDSIKSWTGLPKERLNNLLNLYEELRGIDSKFETLLEALRWIWEEDEKAKQIRRKIIVFSFFPRTLDYLSSKLAKHGINATKIHGKIKVYERETNIDEFMENVDIAVLLTSDVGGEGIDLQKASVLINYDLPWNPMVVEQRIGRIDRIGQQAEKVVIINLVIKDSVEEKVLKRLLDKIEIFKMSIGEPDPIIGEQIEKLTSEALRGQLSEEQLREKVEKTGEALFKQIDDARKMLSKVDKLLAADQSLIDEINAITGERQIPEAEELLHFLNRFLARNYPGHQLSKDATKKIVKMDLRGRLAMDIEKTAHELGSNALSFARRLQSAPIELTLSRNVGYRHANLDTVHFKHPLVLFALKEFSRSDECRQAAFSLSLPVSKKLIEAGTYGFLIATLDIESRRPNTKMLALYAPLRSDSVVFDQDITIPLTLEILQNGKDTRMPDVNEADIITIKNRLLNTLTTIKNEWNERERKLELSRKEQQLAALKATLTLRVRRGEERLASLMANQASSFPLRMAEAKLKKAKDELSSALKHFSAVSQWREIESEEIATGIVVIGSAG